MENTQYNVKTDLENSNKKLKRLRKRAIVKSIVTTVFLVGGVTTGILLPNPISMAVILGCTTILSGSEGIKHTIKRLSSTKATKRKIQAVDKETDEVLAQNMVVEKLRNQIMGLYPTEPYPNGAVASPSFGQV